MSIGQYLTTAEVARILKVSAFRISQFIAEGRLTVALSIGSANLFDRKAVEQFAKKPRKTGRPKKIA